MASVDDIKKLRANATDRTIILDFWSMKCKDCMDRLIDYENTYRMYRHRKFDMITISTDKPSDQAKVTDFFCNSNTPPARISNSIRTSTLKFLEDVVRFKVENELALRAGTWAGRQRYLPEDWQCGHSGSSAKCAGQYPE